MFMFMVPVTKTGENAMTTKCFLASASFTFLNKAAGTNGTSYRGKAKLLTRKPHGLRTPQGVRLVLFHVKGNLPEPEFTDGFC